MSESQNNRLIFKYNMSFYYQSTIIYFVVLVIYIIVRGEFVEDEFTLIVKDPIMYLLALIVFVSIISLIYNLYKNKYLEITDNEISYVNRSRRKSFLLKDISSIKISKGRRRINTNAFRLVRIKVLRRKRPLVIRPYDYENEELLMKKIQSIKESIEKK